MKQYVESGNSVEEADFNLFNDYGSFSKTCDPNVFNELSNKLTYIIYNLYQKLNTTWCERSKEPTNQRMLHVNVQVKQAKSTANYTL